VLSERKAVSKRGAHGKGTRALRMETRQKHSGGNIRGEFFHLMPWTGLYTMRALAHDASQTGSAVRVCLLR